MFLDITGWQDAGKTSLAVWLCVKYSHNFQRRIIGDVIFHNLPNTFTLSKSGIRNYFGKLVIEEHRNEIILLDEVDTVFSHRFWQKGQQSEQLLDAFQDEKLNLLIISTSHMGRGFDLLLRDACRLIMIPTMNKLTGLTTVTWGYTDNPAYRGRFTVDVRPIFPHYERWSVVKDD